MSKLLKKIATVMMSVTMIMSMGMSAGMAKIHTLASETNLSKEADGGKDEQFKQDSHDYEKEEDNKDDKIVWIVDSVNEWEDVQMVKDSLSIETGMGETYHDEFLDRAFFQKDGKSGLVDLKGTEWLEPVFDKLECFFDVVKGTVNENTEAKDYDANGNEVFAAGRGAYRYVWDENTSTLVGGFIELVLINYEAKGMFVAESVKWNGLQPYETDDFELLYSGKYRLFDKTNELLVNELYDEIKHDSSDRKYVIGEYAIAKKDGLWGYIKEDGTYLIDHIYQDAYPFYDGVAAVEQDDAAGFIKEDGTKLFDFVFEETRSIDAGLAWVKYHGKWGVVDVLKTAEKMKETETVEVTLTEEDENETTITITSEETEMTKETYVNENETKKKQMTKKRN